MKLAFDGIVSCGDNYRVYSDEEPGAIRIGGTDIVDAIAEEKWGKNVKVTLNGEEIANGKCVADTGWGYSEYTPVDTDTLNVGKCDLLEKLEDLEGQHVVLVVEDQ